MRARIRVKPYGTKSPSVNYFILSELSDEEAKQFPGHLRTSSGDYFDLQSLRRYRRDAQAFYNDPDKYVIETDDIQKLASILGCPVDEPGLEESKD